MAVWIWHLDYTEHASAAAFTESYAAFQRAASQQEPSYRVRGILTDGFEQHPQEPADAVSWERAWAIACAMRSPSSPRNWRRSRRRSARPCAHNFTACLYRARQRKGLRVFALGQRLRRFADHVAATAGAANGPARAALVPGQEGGLVCGIADPQMPVTSTLLDQAHNTIDRKLFMMKGFHHPVGANRRFSRGWHICTICCPISGAPSMPGSVAWKSKAGRVPTCDWLLNLQILTSGGFR